MSDTTPNQPAVPERRETSVCCSGCGEKFDCLESVANGPGPVLCDDCEDARAGTWRPDPHYRGGYDYACGYHD